MTKYIIIILTSIAVWEILRKIPAWIDSKICVPYRKKTKFGKAISNIVLIIGFPLWAVLYWLVKDDPEIKFYANGGLRNDNTEPIHGLPKITDLIRDSHLSQ